jgi:hypothetical protein
VFGARLFEYRDQDHDASDTFQEAMSEVMNFGRERTEDDFRQLFDAAGLQVTRPIPTLAPQWVIEGTLREAPRRCR